MTAVWVGSYTPGTPEWHNARVDGLGGSEVAAALGLSPWCSPFTCWHRKRGTIGPGEESPSMYWGKKQEPIILDEFARARGVESWVNSPGMFALDGWRIASPDALHIDGDSLWEGKTADSHDSWEWDPDGYAEPDAIPIYYRVQCLWYGDILDRHDIWLSVLIGGNDFRTYRVPWDQDEVDDIRGRAWAFWQTVVNNERPPIDGSDSTYQAIKELHPDIDGEDIEVPADIAAEYLDSDLTLKDIKVRAQQAKNRLLDAMGNARLAVVGGEPIARRQPGNHGGISLYPLHPKEMTP